MKALIVPSTTEMNRGDQALLYESIRVVESCGFDSIAVTGDPECVYSQLVLEKCTLVPSLIANPRRGLSAKSRRVTDSYITRLLMAVNAALDLLESVWTLVICPYSLLRRLLPRRIRRSLEALSEASAVFVKGGGFLHSYGGLRWLYYLWFQSYPILLASRMSKKIIVLPNSFGPFEGYLSRLLVAKVLRLCTVVMARESVSAQTVKPWVNVRSYPDLAFACCRRAYLDVWRELEKHGAANDERVCVGITIRPWRFPRETDPISRYRSYIRAVSVLIDHIQALGCQPILYCQTTGPSAHEDDRIAAQDIIASRKDKNRLAVVHDERYSFLDYAAMYAEMDYMICTRFHSFIFAVSQGVPSIAIAYGGNKATGICTDMGSSDYVIPIEKVTGESLISLFDRLVATREEVVQRSLDYVHLSNRRREEMLAMLIRTLEDGDRI